MFSTFKIKKWIFPKKKKIIETNVECKNRIKYVLKKKFWNIKKIKNEREESFKC